MGACTICAGLHGVLWEGDQWRVVLNRNQDLLGKTMIVLKRHAERVPELTPREWAELLDLVRDVTDRLADAFAPDHFNYAFLMNADPHVHLHVIPRYVGTRTVAAATWSDPDYPDRYRAPTVERRLAPDEEEIVRRALLATR